MVSFYILVLSDHLRLDKGTETGQMATIHSFLREYTSDSEDDATATNHVHYGPSTNNKVLCH